MCLVLAMVPPLRGAAANRAAAPVGMTVLKWRDDGAQDWELRLAAAACFGMGHGFGVDAGMEIGQKT